MAASPHKQVTVGVIMAGGSGTRFWPRSTQANPKQFHSFFFNHSLIEMTSRRLGSLIPIESQWVVTTAALEPKVRAQLPGVRVLAEPMGRNTAPCVFWAALEASKMDPEAVMVVIPSDQTIRDEPAFERTLARAMDWARTHDDLVVLGIQPTRPETGFGYVEAGAGDPAPLVKFREKPDLETAQKFLASGNMLWNAGMFVWRASVILKAFDQVFPEMRRAWNQHGGNAVDAYAHVPAISIDYAVMEKTKNAVVFRLDCGWDDLGSWRALEEMARDRASTSGAEVFLYESSGCFVDAGKPVALLGVDDLLIVETKDILLVARKDQAEDLKKLVEAVRARRPDLV